MSDTPTPMTEEEILEAERLAHKVSENHWQVEAINELAEYVPVLIQEVRRLQEKDAKDTKIFETLMWLDARDSLRVMEQENSSLRS